jgi:hypothetical protein
MQRWEYRVVSLRDGTYTATLNEYSREGWELVTVTPQLPGASTPDEGGGMPMPRAFGRLEDARAKLNKLGADDPTDAPADATSNLLWVLRRPLPEDRSDDAFDVELDS